jgi:hypothetical protein
MIELENITTFENNGICIISVLVLSDVVVIFFSSVAVLPACKFGLYVY